MARGTLLVALLTLCAIGAVCASLFARLDLAALWYLGGAGVTATLLRRVPLAARPSWLKRPKGAIAAAALWPAALPTALKGL
jgi:hypothetical protein